MPSALSLGEAGGAGPEGLTSFTFRGGWEPFGEGGAGPDGPGV